MRQLYRGVQPGVEWACGLSRLARAYEEICAPGLDTATFADRALQHLKLSWEIATEEAAVLKDLDGPVVVCANHPFGGIDFLALALLMEMLRPGNWKMFANHVTRIIPGGSSRLIAAEPVLSGAEAARINRSALLQANRHLATGGLLGFFPAGRVSHRPRGEAAVRDRDWSDHAVRLAVRNQAALVCLHVPGHNSRTFLAIPPAWPQIRALMLAREILAPTRKTIRLEVASMYTAEQARQFTHRGPRPGARLRADCYWRADANLTAGALPEQHETRPAVAAQDASEQVQAEARRLSETHRLAQHAGYDLLLLRGDESPPLLRELGRCRELTFRAAGQGVGQPLDLGPEDDYYHHLVLWHRERAELAGAYRLGMVDTILETHGEKALYLDHIFRIHPSFYRRVAPACELSRSFVLPSYQGDKYALAGLWKGLAAAAVRHGIRNWFGSVTISNQHHPATRALLVQFLRNHYADAPSLRRLVRARHAFQPQSQYHSLVAEAYAGQSIEALAPLVSRMERGQRGIPPLMRYYCSLNARFLAFHVEPSFQDALYCLLRVDLNHLPASYRRRFF
jgi:putative hemolysin